MFRDHGALFSDLLGRSVGNLGIIHCNKSLSSSPSCMYLQLFYFMSTGSVIEHEHELGQLDFANDCELDMSVTG
jgi:hypothetical protein